MKTNTPPQSALRHCAGGRAKRGSAIVLVLVSMVLMAILAGSLLQLARFERIPRGESNIEIVIESVIAEILNQATDDLLDVNGDFLNVQFTNTSGGADEPWDYPWTNFNRVNSAANPLRTTDRLDGTPVYPRGGVMDDTWLADHMPDFRTAAAAGSLPASSGTFDATNGIWRKITSLTGLFIRGEDGTSDLSSVNGNLIEDTVDFSGVNNRDMNIATNSTILVDADGDGIGDSRYEWAPLRQIGGTQYVMAVRIVDLSARIDANIATGRFNATSASLTRGDSPSELNGQQFVSDGAVAAGTTQAIATDEWLAVLNYHLSSNATPGATTPIGAATETRYDNNLASPVAGSRRHHWTEGASRVSNRFSFNGENSSGGYDYRNAFFGQTDAFELLQGGGVNSANTTTIENLMPNFLRRGGQEDNYAIGNINGWSRRQFWENDPRKHVTVYSGESTAIKPVTTADDRELKLDINQAVKTTAGRTTLRERINTFLTEADNDAALLALYPHLNSRGAFANQLAANIADYIDNDNFITRVNGKAGFEALPYITEVYIQRPYTVGAVVVDPMDGSKDVTWQGQGSTPGYAIEIGNPFGRYDGTSWVGRPVSLENIWLKIGSNAAQLLSSFTGMPTELAPGEVVIVYSNSVGGDPTLDDVTQLWATPSGNANIAATVANTTTMANGSFTVALHAEDQDSTGSALSWRYSGCDVFVQSGPVNENLTSLSGDFASIAVNDKSYAQSNYRGVGEGIRMMAVHPAPTSTNPRGFAEFIESTTEISANRVDGTGAAELAETVPTFGSESKTGVSTTTFSAMDEQQIVWHDNPRERLHWVGDILQIPLIGPNPAGSGNASTMGKALFDAGMDTSINGIPDLLLPYQMYSGTSVAPVVNNNTTSTATTGRFGVFNYPHAILLLEQFTTFNPATDGEDGDGQSDSSGESFTNPDDDEVLVPGRLNLNTAPFATLQRLLPFPDATTRTQVANAIIARRESLTQQSGATSYGTGANDIPAIAYTTALYEQIENLTGAGGNPSQDGADTQSLGGTRIDLNEYEEPQGTFVAADGIDADREEEIMLAKWLNEVAGTRSDVFAAYIVVQGYPADNFQAGADESARLIIIFSRANVEGAGDKAVEIGRFRIN